MFDSRWCYWHNSSGRAVVFAYTRPVTENENQEYFLEGKGGRYLGLTTLQPSYVVWKSGSLNLLKPSGSVQDCIGIVLQFLMYLWKCNSRIYSVWDVSIFSVIWRNYYKFHFSYLFTTDTVFLSTAPVCCTDSFMQDALTQHCK